MHRVHERRNCPCWRHPCWEWRYVDGNGRREQWCRNELFQNEVHWNHYVDDEGDYERGCVDGKGNYEDCEGYGDGRRRESGEGLGEFENGRNEGRCEG